MADIPDGFRWRKPAGHLSYSVFAPPELLIAHARSVTTTRLKGYSLVHEKSHDGYDHTHFAFLFDKALDLTGARKFDIIVNGVVYHPHMWPKLSARSLEVLFNEYHLGRKYDITVGKKVYTEPAGGPWQMLPPEFEWAREIMKEVVQAVSLQEAVVAAGVRPRSVMDVKMLRRDAENTPKKFKHLYPLSSFKVPLLPHNWQVLHMWGATGLGKTKLACALFNNPLYIKPFNEIGQIEKLQGFDPKVHDGIVLDEVDLRAFSRELGIGLTDFEEESTISIRYGKVDLPAGVKKIFLSNKQNVWPLTDLSIGAIARRVCSIHITSKVY